MYRRQLHYVYSIESNLAENHIVVHEAFLTKHKDKVTGRTNLFSASGSIVIKTTLVKSLG